MRWEGETNSLHCGTPKCHSPAQLQCFQEWLEGLGSVGLHVSSLPAWQAASLVPWGWWQRVRHPHVGVNRVLCRTSTQGDAWPGMSPSCHCVTSALPAGLLRSWAAGGDGHILLTPPCASQHPGLFPTPNTCQLLLPAHRERAAVQEAGCVLWAIVGPEKPKFMCWMCLCDLQPEGTRTHRDNELVWREYSDHIILLAVLPCVCPGMLGQGTEGQGSVFGTDCSCSYCFISAVMFCVPDLLSWCCLRVLHNASHGLFLLSNNGLWTPAQVVSFCQWSLGDGPLSDPVGIVSSWALPFLKPVPISPSCSSCVPVGLAGPESRAELSEADGKASQEGSQN